MTIYIGASGNFIIFPVFRKNIIMANFQVCVCVCVRIIESSLKVSNSCQQAHPAADLLVYECGNNPVVCLISILFLSPCPQTPLPTFFCS